VSPVPDLRGPARLRRLLPGGANTRPPRFAGRTRLGGQCKPADGISVSRGGAARVAYRYPPLPVVGKLKSLRPGGRDFTFPIGCFLLCATRPAGRRSRGLFHHGVDELLRINVLANATNLAVFEFEDETVLVFVLFAVGDFAAVGQLDDHRVAIAVDA